MTSAITCYYSIPYSWTLLQDILKLLEWWKSNFQFECKSSRCAWYLQLQESVQWDLTYRNDIPLDLVEQKLWSTWSQSAGSNHDPFQTIIEQAEIETKQWVEPAMSCVQKASTTPVENPPPLSSIEFRSCRSLRKANRLRPGCGTIDVEIASRWHLSASSSSCLWSFWRPHAGCGQNFSIKQLDSAISLIYNLVISFQIYHIQHIR